MRKFFNVLSSVVFFLVVITAGCSTEPTFGDKVKEIGDRWNQGDKMIKDGEDMIKEGETMIQKGNTMIKQGHQLKTESERAVPGNTVK